MLRVVLDKPGEFRGEEGATPALEDGHALVRVHRIGVCGTDLHAFAGKQPFFDYPRVLGHELGVEIVEVAANPFGLAAGDQCTVEPYINCGGCIACRRGRQNCCLHHQTLGVQTDGGMCQLLAVPIRKLHRSRRLTLEQLALVETLCVGAHAVERAGPEVGEAVLVVGAGPIGMGAIQLAQLSGAEVIVMDVNDQRLRFCREQLGVRHTINPTEGEPVEQLRAIGEDLPTVVVDATGHPSSMMNCFEYPAHGGRIVFVGLFQGDVTFNDPNFHKRELTVMSSRNALPSTFRTVIRLMETGRLDTSPWVTHRLGLEDVVSQFAGLRERADLVKAIIEVPR